MAAISVSRGGFHHAGLRRVHNRRRARLVDFWFVVYAVRIVRNIDPWASLLICLVSEVLRSQLRVDLTVLCDLAERLSGLFIMAHNATSRRGILHNVAMPRSWFITLIPDTDLRKDISTYSAFAEAMIDLMKRIDAQIQRLPTSASDSGGQFIVDGGGMTSFTGPLCIARM